jgi:hypothetical protein
MNKSIMQNADKGTVVMSDLEESLKKGQTGVVEFANIDNFAEEITNDCVKNMFETMHSSPNRNTMPVTINGKCTEIKYSEQSDSSILAFAALLGGDVHKGYGQEEPLRLHMIIDGSNIMLTNVFDPTEQVDTCSLSLARALLLARPRCLSPVLVSVRAPRLRFLSLSPMRALPLLYALK